MYDDTLFKVLDIIAFTYSNNAEISKILVITPLTGAQSRRAMRKRAPLSCFEGQFRFFFFSVRAHHIFILIASEMLVVKVRPLEICLLYPDAVSISGMGIS